MCLCGGDTEHVVLAKSLAFSPDFPLPPASTPSVTKCGLFSFYSSLPSSPWSPSPQQPPWSSTTIFLHDGEPASWPDALSGLQFFRLCSPAPFSLEHPSGQGLLEDGHQ